MGRDMSCPSEQVFIGCRLARLSLPDRRGCSNLRLGVYPDLAAHPLPRLYAAGVPVTVNSDDPPLFNTTLNQEVALLAEPFGFDLATINQLLLNGARYSFLPSDEKRALEARFQAEMTALQQQVGLD